MEVAFVNSYNNNIFLISHVLQGLREDILNTGQSYTSSCTLSGDIEVPMEVESSIVS